MSSKPFLIFLPGLDGTGRLLFRQTGLHDEYRVACESYPQDRPHTYEELADEAAKRIKNENNGLPAIVVAESFGGAVAFTLVERHPDLVERMVLSNTFAYFSRRWLIKPLAMASHLLPNQPARAETRRVRSWFFFDPKLPKDIRDQTWEQTGDVPLRAMGRRIRMLAKIDLRERLPHISVPTVIVVSPNDRVVPPCCGQLIADRLPNVELIEKPVGHAALLHPDVCVRSILADRSVWDKISQPQDTSATATPD
ncbi:alpha/beta fold hydrolase [Thalassoroseus pseudoceratinae]|uniref:alpha/beta fold hydrolase n=1 Tax=Thalassoroseus pseudoceratinae TaxID=2713176 RepID=UPI00141E5C3A|nr:alpha/beta hydrolase [Thalassoroseus pseudoceratinae]